MLAMIFSVVLATCDLGEHFAKPEAWSESADDFAVDHQQDGFGFVSQKRDVINCMKRGASSWYGLEVWEARIYYGAEGATKAELSLYNRGDDQDPSGLDANALKTLLDQIAEKAQPGAADRNSPASSENSPTSRSSPDMWLSKRMPSKSMSEKNVGEMCRQK